MSKKIFAALSLALFVAACAQQQAAETVAVADPVTVDAPDPNGKF